MRRVFIASMLLFVPVGSTHADEEFSANGMAITISPFHLLCPELHLTGELRLTPRMSVAAMLGAGQVTDEGKTSGIWEAGGQFRYYLLGSFTHGFMLCVDAGYVDINSEIENPMTYLAGVRAGAAVGYKITMKSGFVLEAQIGPVHVWGDSDNSEWQTLENLKVGWSF